MGVLRVGEDVRDCMCQLNDKTFCSRVRMCPIRRGLNGLIDCLKYVCGHAKRNRFTSDILLHCRPKTNA